MTTNPSSTRTNRAEDANRRTDRRSSRSRRPVAPAMCSLLLVAGGLLAACSSPSGRSITLYSGQHVQTTDALVAAFERATGITVNVRPGDEDDLANQIVVEGSHSPADVIFTENSPRSSTCRKGACSLDSMRRRSRTPRAGTTLPKASGSGCRRV